MCLSKATRALVRASHPVPTAAVTVLSTALGAVLGVRGLQLLTLVVAVLAGQLSVGWLNDVVDRHRDRAAGRTDKPLAVGEISAVSVWRAVVAAAAVCVPASLALGPGPGAMHLVAVAGAWAYNLGLKRTVWSWVPYALGFGLLPVVVWWVSPLGDAPPWWMIVGAALLGVGAHGANVLPDLDTDRTTGVAGLPHRLPGDVLRPATAVALLSALGLMTLAPAGPVGPLEIATFVLGAGLAIVAAGFGTQWPGQVVGRHALPARTPLVAAAGVAALAVASLLARGAPV